MGVGVLQFRDNGLTHVHHVVVRPKAAGLPERLKTLYSAVTELVRAHQPQVVAIEDVFQLKNVRSAITLAHARAAAVLAAANLDVRVESYSPAEVKQSVTGSGRADKHQVAEMVKFLLRLDDAPPSDAADALAVAICHSMRGPVRALAANR